MRNENPIDIPMIVWLGGEQRCASQGGGPRLLRFESPWWRLGMKVVRIISVRSSDRKGKTVSESEP
jgi:hypothetical protein